MGIRRRSLFGGRRALDAADVAIFKGAVLSRAGALTHALNYYRNLFGVNSFAAVGTPVQGRVSLLPLPVLQIWAANDGALGTELTQGTDRLCANYRLVVLEDCSHWIAEDAASEAVQLIADFLSLPVDSAVQEQGEAGHTVAV